MKEVICTLALILLGITIASTQINGAGATSMQTGASNMTDNTIKVMKDHFTP